MTLGSSVGRDFPVLSAGPQDRPTLIFFPNHLDDPWKPFTCGAGTSSNQTDVFFMMGMLMVTTIHVFCCA